MDNTAFFSIYLGVFIVILLVSQQQRSIKKALHIKMKKRGFKIMANEIIKKYIGVKCILSTGTFGTNSVGVILNVNENWVEVKTKRGIEIINAEFVQHIKILDKSKFKGTIEGVV